MDRDVISDEPNQQPAVRLPPPPAPSFAPGHTGVLPDSAVVFELDRLEVHYGAFRAVRDVTMNIFNNEITAFIGPSGCGKTTVLRCFNRMHDVTPGARVGG